MIILSGNKSGWVQAQAGTDRQALDNMIQGMRERGIQVQEVSGSERRLFRIAA